MPPLMAAALMSPGAVQAPPHTCRGSVNIRSLSVYLAVICRDFVNPLSLHHSKLQPCVLRRQPKHSGLGPWLPVKAARRLAWLKVTAGSRFLGCCGS